MGSDLPNSVKSMVILFKAGTEATASLCMSMTYEFGSAIFFNNFEMILC